MNEKSNQINSLETSVSEGVISEDTLGLLVHSYNNYLSGLMGFSELALLECQQDVVKERLGMALESGYDAVTFGKQLLSSIGRLQVALKPVCLNKILKQLSNDPDKLTINFIDLNEKDECLIKTDQKWFLYCLQSLLIFCDDFSKLKATNAVDSNKVSLTVSESKELLEITLFAGFQFEPEQIECLFNPFYTSRTLLGKKDVGLAMLKGFIQQMKGNIEWQNGKGFLLTLPKLN